VSSLAPLTAPLLDRAGVRHGFFTRQGGVSQGIYEGLNVGQGSSDDPAAVRENRARATAHFGAGAIVTPYQVHSALTATATGPWPGDPPQVDGVVSATRGVVCAVLAADCAPILLFDPHAGVVGAAHAGWKGALTGVVEDTIARMEGLGAKPGRIVAAVGPCIGPRSYEVGLEFLDRFVADDAANARFFAPGAASEKRMFDLPAFVLNRLRGAGVEACEWIGADTCSDAARFFSNRRAFKAGEPDFGRLLSAIVLDGQTTRAG